MKAQQEEFKATYDEVKHHDSKWVMYPIKRQGCKMYREVYTIKQAVKN